MTEQEHNTEKIILNAAKEVFIKYGYNGARMQQIADEAGINKALLHYYFRSKEKLFDAIFEEAFITFIPNVTGIFSEDATLEKKIRKIISAYMDMLMKNPYLPVFIAQELQLNPGRILGMIKKTGIQPEKIMNILEKDLKKERIQGLPALHFFVNTLGLCVFPFIAKPLLEGLILKNKPKAFENFIEERKKIVADFIINSLKTYKRKKQ